MGKPRVHVHHAGKYEVMITGYPHTPSQLLVLKVKSLWYRVIDFCIYLLHPALLKNTEQLGDALSDLYDVCKHGNGQFTEGEPVLVNAHKALYDAGYEVDK